MKKVLENKRGITLIALVITIIVLLILAGITIATLTGENGILTRASDASRETELASEKERVKLAAMAALADNLGQEIIQEDLENELGKQFASGKYTVDTGTNEDGTEGYIVTITENDEAGRKYFVDKNANINEYTEKEPVQVPEKGGKDFSRENGKIDILFLEGDSYNQGNANAPVIDSLNMIPVNWNGNNWVVTDEKNWEYSYDENNKKWANVMLRDTLVVEGIADAKIADLDEMEGKIVTTEGSMFVWIPRYAYKITYYDTDDTNQTGSPIGYSDARGFVDAEGKTPEGMNEPLTSIAVGDNYRTHPAFENGKNTGYLQGEWDKKLEGIWIGKFESTEKVNDKLTVSPNSTIYSNKEVGIFYTEALELGIGNSHMTKDSEYCAMLYLTQSRFGVKLSDITENQNEEKTGGENYVANTNQSTTGNIFGIYDVKGGKYEYTTAYIPSGTQNYGKSFASIDNTTNNKTESTRYATAYNIMENEDTVNYDIITNKIFGSCYLETEEWKGANIGWVGGAPSNKCPFSFRAGFDLKGTKGGMYISVDTGFTREGLRTSHMFMHIIKLDIKIQANA